MDIGWECAKIAAEYKHLYVFRSIKGELEPTTKSKRTARNLTNSFSSMNTQSSNPFRFTFRISPAQDQQCSSSLFVYSPFYFQLLCCGHNQRISKLDQYTHIHEAYSIVIFYAATQITVNRMGFLVHCILLQRDIFKLFQLVPTYTLFIHSFDLNYAAIWHENCSSFQLFSMETLSCAQTRTSEKPGGMVFVAHKIIWSNWQYRSLLVSSFYCQSMSQTMWLLFLYKLQFPVFN